MTMTSAEMETKMNCAPGRLTVDTDTKCDPGNVVTGIGRTGIHFQCFVLLKEFTAKGDTLACMLTSNLAYLIA